MLDAELVTDKHFSKEYIEELIKRHGWSCALESGDKPKDLYILNEKGKSICWLTLNGVDVKGGEKYPDDLFPEEIEEDLKNKLFADFKPHYNFLSYFSDTGNDLLKFFHMLKEDGLKVFYSLEDDKEFKKL